MRIDTNRDRAIAVVGASVLYPGSKGSASFWTNILSGQDFMSDIPDGHWLIDDYYNPDPTAPRKIYSKRGAFLPAVNFDPVMHSFPPKQLSTTDTAQLLGIIVAQKVLDDAASVQFAKVDKKNISVILGVASATELVGQMAGSIQRPHWVKALRDAGLPESQVQDICNRIENTYPDWNESTFPGLLGNVIAGRIANRLDLGGTNCVIDAACASSLGAVSMAVQELLLGHSDLVITGGADALNDPFMFMCFSKTPALSLTGDCRPFAESADGTMLGEGIGMLALRRLADAERDGDKIYAVLRGIGSSSDGRAKSIYAPRAEGQEIAIRRAYERAGYGMEEVALIEAHGTATKAGDVAEFEGLRRAFADVARQDLQWCALGSIKSQIGHTKAAAGTASLFKIVMALHHKVLPPTIKVDKPNSKLEIEKSPFYLNTQARPWIQAPGRTRKASVSAFGFGGSNFHAALEEYSPLDSAAPRFSNLPVHLILLGAEDPQKLLEKSRSLQNRLKDGMLPLLGRETQLAFNAGSVCRLAILAKDSDTARSGIGTAIESINKAPDQSFSLNGRFHYHCGGLPGKIAFLFPGQGSQYVNMGAGLAMEFPAARRVWDNAAAIPLDPELALQQVVFPIPVFSDAERQQQTDFLTRTDWAQPAIGAASLSMLAIMDQLGVKPAGVAGHSYGEISALHAAGVIKTPDDMLKVSRRRGELMRAAAKTPGAMFAVKSSFEKIQQLIRDHEIPGISVANINSPTQVVVAGEVAAIEQFAKILSGQGITGSRLPVATAFHTDMVAPVSIPFGEFLADLPLGEPAVPVYGNTLAEPYSSDLCQIRQTLAGQLAKPVRFADTIVRMYEDGFRLFVEVGPGSVLTPMVSDCLQGKPHLSLAMDNRKADGRVTFLNTLGALSAQGVAIDYSAFWAEFAQFEQPEDVSKLSPATVQLNGANYGKPYPPADGARGRTKPNPEHPAGSVTKTVAVSKLPSTAHSPLTAIASRSGMPEKALDSSWATAFEKMQQQTFEAQQAFTQAMSESHQQFLRTSEAAFMQLGRLRGESGLAPAVESENGNNYRIQIAGQGESSVVSSLAAAPSIYVGQKNAAVNTVIAGADYQKLLLEIVADKTGYPESMLTLDMELESGLGIDSIKKVEILAALQERIPELEQMDTSKLASLSTLREIVDFAAGSVVAKSPAKPSSSKDAGVVHTSQTIDYQSLLMEIVADKTGYPQSMLNLEMELEAGLGIDSIKKVEILSALQERIPELEQMDTSKLASLSTLREIVDFAASSVVAKSSANPSHTPQTIDYQSLLMEIVADKTGYPQAMLTLDMELEAGLGIDSIKKVEILSALQERIPELEKMDTSKLTSLNTLREIVDFAASSVSNFSDSSAGVTSGSAVTEKPAAAESLQRLVVALNPSPATGLVLSGLYDADPLYIVAENYDPAEILAEKLRNAGVKAVVVANPPVNATALMIMSAFGHCDQDAETQSGINEAVFKHLKTCAASMAARGILLITVQNTGGSFGLNGITDNTIWSAGIAAAAKTAAIEWPVTAVKAIDIETAGVDPQRIAHSLFLELLTGGDQVEVGLHADGSRWIPVVEKEPMPVENKAELKIDGVVLVSGGARGVTAACVAELLRRAPCRLAILGRTPLRDEPAGLEGLSTDAELKQALLQLHQQSGKSITPQQLGAEVREILAQRELHQNLLQFQSLGGEVRYYAADVSNEADVVRVTDEIRQKTGPIQALIHAAGVLADKEIQAKTPEQFQQVFQTKVRGFRNLLNATRNDTLTHVACFSSIVARRGNAGQIDYAMANEVLNRVCQHEKKLRGTACLVKAIGWGPWAGGMVNPALEKHFNLIGVKLIPVDEGARFFADELTGHNGNAVEVIFGGGLDNFAVKQGKNKTPAAFDLRFHQDTHPYIASHVTRGGLPAVPMVAVNDACLSAARTFLPGAVLNGTANLRVVKGITLNDYSANGDRYKIECQMETSGKSVLVRVIDLSGVVHYTLEVPCSNMKPQEKWVNEPRLNLSDWKPASGKIYDGRLFHGPDLHVIEELTGLGENACAGVLRSKSSQQIGSAYQIDILDGGLQLVGLWTHEFKGQDALPTSLESCYFNPVWPHGKTVYCEARCEMQAPMMNRWNLRYLSSDGELLGFVKGIKSHLLPKLEKSQKESAAQ